jgi:predicted membrane protein
MDNEERDRRFIKNFSITAIISAIAFFIIPGSGWINIPFMFIWLCWYLIKRRMRG